MASNLEKGWLTLHSKGSVAARKNLHTKMMGRSDAVGAAYKSFMSKNPTLDPTQGASVKQASKAMGVDKVKAAARAKLSAKAYGATKGTKVGEIGGEKAQGERDTVVPLTKDQHSKVQAAKKAAEVAAKPVKAKPAAAPKAAPKKLSQAERIAAIAKAARKAQSKHDVATPDPDDRDHDDLRDVHDMLHVPGAKVQYEEREPRNEREANKAMQTPEKMETLKRLAAIAAKAKKKLPMRKEETEQVDEVAKWRTNPKAYDVDTDGSILPKTFGAHDYLKARDEYLSGAKKYIASKIKNPKNARKQTQAYAKSAIKMHTPEWGKKEIDEQKGFQKEETHTSSKSNDVPFAGPYSERKNSSRSRVRKLARRAMDAAIAAKAKPVKKEPVNEMDSGQKGHRGDEDHGKGPEKYVKPVKYKDLLVSLKDAPIKRPRGSGKYNPAQDFPGVKVFQKEETGQNDTAEKVEMAQTQLHFIGYAVKEILDFISKGGEVEEWYQNKLSKVHSDVESLHSYVEGEKRRTGMVAEEHDQAADWQKVQRMEKGSMTGGKEEVAKHLKYLTAVHAHQRKHGLDTLKTRKKIEQINKMLAETISKIINKKVKRTLVNLNPKMEGQLNKPSMFDYNAEAMKTAQSVVNKE